MNYTVFDIEADNLLDKVTKIHCLSYKIYNNKDLLSSGSIIDYNEIKVFISNQKILVGHNIIRYDIPVLEKVLGIKVLNDVFDTLGISYYLFPIKNYRHGLGVYGERLGYGKPIVSDWENQPIKVYIHRCESDVEINSRLFHQQMNYLMQIYDGNIENVFRILRYLNFKLDCLKDQEQNGITLDKELVNKSLLELDKIISDKIKTLTLNMPKNLGKVLHKVPKNLHKQNETLSAHGVKWLEKLKDFNLPFETTEIRELPNPGSPLQLKDWLLSLGWIPETFKISKSTGENLPQVSLPFGAGLCSSIKKMFVKFPYLIDLDGLYKAQHRYGLFKSFLQNADENGFVYSTSHGLTSTLRLQHSKPICNLPGVNNYYGKEIRGSLKVPNEDYIMCNSDVSGLEDNTKQHYIYFFDPDYVNKMRVPGFDPHIDIAVLAEMLTVEDEEFFKYVSSLKDLSSISEEDNNRFKEIKKIRSLAKTVNFGCVYGAGPAKIQETLGCTLSFATKLHTTYWERNKAVKQIAKSCTVKVVNNQKWLYNPISGFWIFLKAEKDRFSGLNQNSGVYFFDSFLSKVRKELKKLNIVVLMQYHDELTFVFKKEEKENCEAILKQAIIDTNKELNLNVTIDISIEFGKNYSETH